MNFNSIFEPFTRLKDAIKCIKTSKLVPAYVPDRTNKIATIMGSNNPSEISHFTEVIESILPSFGDDLSTIDSDMEKDFKTTGIALRHLVPHVTSCCGTACVIKECNKCIVFEVGGVYDGVTYSSRCKKCRTVYYLNYFKSPEKQLSYYNQQSCQYFQSTRQSVFENKFITSTDRDM